ncbi:MAG: cytochrome P450 [Ardenticatenaceae bacterium]|nr:cytochrome P450 [Anaerolineales bacterium]MCB8922542.1 cytochrome P450 [Ardenticatenaceae bacterium]
MTKQISSLPPVTAGLPVLGNALDMAQDIRDFLLRQYLKHGPIFRVRALNRSYTVIAGVEANLFATKESRRLFSSHDFWYEQDEEMGALRSLISMDGDDHVRFRKVQQRGYSRSAINGSYEQVVAITRAELQQWGSGKALSAHYAIQRIITEQLGQLAAHFSPRAYLDDMIVFVRTLLLTKVTRMRPQALLRLPAYGRAKARAFELADKVIAAHDPDTAVSHPPDLIDDVLALAREDPDFLPERDLRPAILGPFIAGLDTVSSTMAFMLYALLKHPHILVRATAEADELFADGIPTPAMLRNVDVLHRVTLETLRMYPIAPAITRTAVESFEFAGHTVPAGEQVIIATTVPHYLPELYPNPYTFDIDRYLPERKENRQPGAYAPFALGHHTCLGAGFAEVEMILTMATMLHAVQLEMSPRNYDLKIDPAPTPHPDKNFRVQVVARRH